MAPRRLAASRLCGVCALLLLLSSTAALSSGASTLDSICTIPSHPPKRRQSGKDDALGLLNSFQLNFGYFFGGEGIHFAEDGNASYVIRSFSLFPHSVDRTADDSLLHVAATLTLSGGRARSYLPSHHGRRRRYRYVGDHHVRFYLDGYYSYASDELCMTGTGTYSSDGGSIEHLEDVVLKLRIPSPSNLSDPFVTGRLKGASFEAISLVAYAEGFYQYGESASCPTLQPSSPARGAFQALGANFSCAHLKEHLDTSYKLQYGGGGAHAPALMGLHGRQRLHVGQVQCTADGEVRAYAVLYNKTEMRGQLQPHPPFMFEEEVLVAEGRWYSDRSMLCLTACRVERSAETSPSVKECGVGMSFWFPDTWTIRDRSVVAGRIWNTSSEAAGGGSGDVISVSSIDVHNHRSNFSDVRYNYTMVEEAKKYYLNDPVLSDPKKTEKVMGSSFVAPNYTDHDFAFHFYEAKGSVGSGRAYPVTIGSAVVYGDQLAADDSFSQHAVVDMKQQQNGELVNVSYDIRQHVPPAGWVDPKNNSYSVILEERRITAEGVFHPRTGVLCMIACREHDSSTTDCQILITVHFASMDGEAQQQGRGKGAISSLRNKTTDPLFFEKIEIVLYGMYSGQVSESVSRMDLESIMLVVSTTLPCIFAVLQILHVKRRPEAAAGTSITMLVVLSLGHVAPLVVGSEALFLSRTRQYVATPFRSYVPYELSQAMMRAPTLIALLLQLRLIQLAWSARKKTADDAGRSTAEAASPAAAERRALWLCVPVYLAGGALTIVAHAMSAVRAAREEGSLTVRLGPEPATLWEDLVSSAGLALDAFLLPQVAMNAFSASAAGACRVRALSPWFYAGGTVVRALPHVYDVVRARGYVPSLRPSYVYASPRYDRFGVGWDVAVPCAAALLAVLLFLQQRVRPAAEPPLFPSRRRLGEYEMVSNL
ncbi:hypothetical protein GQ55_5G206300 [Panicum hallii var. hallii]|uniref:RING-type E3 ubiquitin transferase n=1 Tax=Panicum hallii var. hallii TaxID=1504633 RepID=A0A2T7DIG7_9POAL|nr:hypothetical protein GQ55_5G206300 [Panicum hallii var. hallii]